MDHEEIRSGFLHTVNIVSPEHPYKDNPFPIREDQIDYGYKRSSSSYYASCGPRSRRNVVGFSADKASFNDFCIERCLAIYTHEMTHIPVGSHSDKEHGGHPPRFWREMSFHALELLDAWNEVEAFFGEASKTEYIYHLIEDEVNEFNVDRRYMDVEEYRDLVTDLLEKRIRKNTSNQAQQQSQQHQLQERQMETQQ